MAKKIHLILLFLCGICSQGIIGNFADEDIKEPSDVLIRQKRVINRISGEDHTVGIITLPYIVQIKEKMRINCVGSILSHRVVITIPACVRLAASEYQVSSGSSISGRGTKHNIIGIRKHFGNHPRRPEDGIALLTVDSPFEFGSFTKYIQLHSEPLLPGTLGSISGWGYNCRSTEHGSIYLKNLRSIEVPILAHRDCVNIYRSNHIVISDKDICTYHPQKHCGHNDGGAPLVVNGFLVGVHLWTGFPNYQIDLQYPDVFALLQHSEYNQWIRTNIQNIETEFENHH